MSLPKHAGTFLLTLALVIFAVILVRTSWITDDAYITFRTIDNWIHGYGLTWNISERVQAYTHPLWMLVLSGVYFFTREIFFTTHWVSIAISVGTLTFFAFRVASSTTGALLGVILLLSSKAFVDFSSSGLENPLTHALLLLFLWGYFDWNLDERKLKQLSIIAGLLVLNRMDTILLIGPMLLVIWRSFSLIGGGRAVLLGFVPFVLWEVFSIFYYGFPFPNTAYAKLNTGIEASELWIQGAYYLLVSLYFDPILLVGLILGSGFALSQNQRQNLPVLMGVLLYGVYVAKIGGDFMAGRFLTTPLLCLVVIFARWHWVIPPVLSGGLAVAILGISLSLPQSSLLSGADYSEGDDLFDQGITDERHWYYSHTGLLKALQKRDESWPQNKNIDRGKQLRSEGPAYLQTGGIGYLGFYAGPEVHIIDEDALAEPLLARLPINDPMWWIGHFKRSIPDGYVASLEAGENRIENPDIAAYYEKLRSIIQGPLWDAQRWIHIVKMNLGLYESLLAQYDPPRLPRPNVEGAVGARVLPIRYWIYYRVFRQATWASWFAPDTAEGWFLLGGSLGLARDFDAALEAFDKSIEADPKYKKSYLGRLGIHVTQGNAKAMLQDFDRAIKANPEDPNFYNSRGMLFLQTKQWGLALQDFGKAIENRPNFVEAYQNRAVLLEALQHREAAIGDWSQVIELDPNGVDAYRHRASLYSATQKFQKAIDDFNRILQGKPEDYNAIMGRGYQYYKMGQVGPALADFNLLIQKHPGNPGAYINRGYIHLQKHDTTQACLDWQQACDLGNCSTFQVHQNEGLCP